jgi:hypothetical protein
MQGKKTPDKLLKMKYTTKWRKYNKLKEIYIKSGDISIYEKPRITTYQQDAEIIIMGKDTYILINIGDKRITVKLNDYLNK